MAKYTNSQTNLRYAFVNASAPVSDDCSANSIIKMKTSIFHKLRGLLLAMLTAWERLTIRLLALLVKIEKGS